MKQAIVSGATGFIGIHLVNELIKNGVKVVALCREGSVNSERIPKEASAVCCGMDDYHKLSEILKDGGYDVFYHLAWEGATGSGRANAELQTKNALRTLEALKAANAVGCDKFIATGTVYENFYEQMSDSNEFKNAAFYIMRDRKSVV